MTTAIYSVANFTRLLSTNSTRQKRRIVFIKMASTVKFAVIDVNDFLSRKQAAEPDLATDWAKLEELYNKKLWHQLTLKTQELVEHPSLKQNDNLIQLYSNFITTFENKINPLSLVEIISHVIEQYQDKREAIAFLEKIEAKVKMNDEALAYCKVLQGQIYLEKLSDYEATEKIIEHLENTLEDADGVTPVHGEFYKLAADYYKVRGPMSRYYRSLLRRVGCAGGGAALSACERRDAGVELTRAALLAPDVYDLSELLAHPLIQALEHTPDRWALQLLAATARGDSAAYDTAVAAAPIPDFKENDTLIRRKLALLCLCQMAFDRSMSQRRLSFAEIAREARVPLAEVELLLMKALAEKLIVGHIDQVAGAGVVRWVRPRALGRAGAAALAARLAAWAGAAARAERLLARAAPDLLTV